ncbi:hypothetical protein F5J12DRAFT_295985 [Pisolithus orientalis]|uniref:uncharacterized protein n=1 Tax=Pisolithus orientalis TaxID=936130 RepID=UPI0022245CE7|nr:uncharacterized protein F5J12DRAFT_295985 [Pisolithus orientalis]KAI6030521.1 hypothetical protein F5J12DRAFT_295985 [Pisolithus orientalis]
MDVGTVFLWSIPFSYCFSCISLSMLVQPIKQGSYPISIPTLSMSRQPSLMALAEHGIGCVIVFEYLFFQSQVKDRGISRKDLQLDLTMVIAKISAIRCSKYCYCTNCSGLPEAW